MNDHDEIFRILVESVKDYAIFLLDREGRVKSWSVGAALIKGYRAEEIIGRSIELFYTPEERANGRPAMLLAQAARDGRVEDEGWRVRKDGSRFWADVVLTALRDDAGRLIGYAKVTRDLTERRQMEEERLRLARSDERFRVIIDSVKDYAIIMLSTDGRIETWNRGAELINGYKANEIIGKHTDTLYLPEDRVRGLPQALLAQAVRDGRVENEGWRLRKGGGRFWADVVLASLHDDTGALIGFSQVTRDLTTRQHAELERVRLDEERLQRARAEEALRIRDEFLSIASHELKTPLTALQIELYALREMDDHPNGERLSRKVSRAARNADRLAGLIESLLDVSRIATGKLKLNLEQFDLSQAIALVVETMRGTGTHAGCTLSFVASGPIVACWDRLRIEQVVMNLLANAFKYGAGGEVTVAVSRQSNDAVVEVRDHGPGVPEKDLPRIFERFERAAPMRNYGGLGLGLYVSREIVLAHGGSIEGRNLPGAGAAFTVRLPLGPRDATEENPPA